MKTVCSQRRRRGIAYVSAAVLLFPTSPAWASETFAPDDEETGVASVTPEASFEDRHDGTGTFTISPLNGVEFSYLIEADLDNDGSFESAVHSGTTTDEPVEVALSDDGQPYSGTTQYQVGYQLHTEEGTQDIVPGLTYQLNGVPVPADVYAECIPDSTTMPITIDYSKEPSRVLTFFAEVDDERLDLKQDELQPGEVFTEEVTVPSGESLTVTTSTDSLGEVKHLLECDEEQKIDLAAMPVIFERGSDREERGNNGRGNGNNGSGNGNGNDRGDDDSDSGGSWWGSDDDAQDDDASRDDEGQGRDEQSPDGDDESSGEEDGSIEEPAPQPEETQSTPEPTDEPNVEPTPEVPASPVIEPTEAPAPEQEPAEVPDAPAFNPDAEQPAPEQGSEGDPQPGSEPVAPEGESAEEAPIEEPTRSYFIKGADVSPEPTDLPLVTPSPQPSESPVPEGTLTVVPSDDLEQSGWTMRDIIIATVLFLTILALAAASIWVGFRERKKRPTGRRRQPPAHRG